MNWMRLLIGIGGALQFLGVTLVFVQIAAVERSLHLPSWTTSVTSPISGALGSLTVLLRIRKKRVLQISSDMHATSTSQGSLDVAVIRAPGRTIRERLDSHQRQLDDLRRDVQGVRETLVADSRQQDAHIRALDERMNKEAATLKTLIAEVGGGSRGLQVAGALLILVGIVFVTIGSLLPTS